MKSFQGPHANLELVKGNLELMAQTGHLADPDEFDTLSIVASPVKGGTLGAKAGLRQRQRLTTELLRQQIDGMIPQRVPYVAPDKGLRLGHITVPFQSGDHLLLRGKTGCGKTNVAKDVIEQVLARDWTVEIFDLSGEWPGEFPDALVVYPETDLTSWCNPVGPRETFYFSSWAELSRFWSVVKGTWLACAEVMISATAGLSADEPFPSLYDQQRMLLKLSEQDNGSKFATASSVLRTLNSVLGANARIRRGIDLRQRFPLVIRQFVGLPLNVYGFFSALQLLRLHAQALTGTLTTPHLIVVDELGKLMGRDLMHDTSAGLDPAKRAFMELRKYGVSILGATQLSSDLDPSVALNCSVHVAGCAPDYVEARAVGKDLQLSDDRIATLQRLTPGEFFVLAPGLPGPQLVTVPNRKTNRKLSKNENVARMAPVLAALESEIIRSPEVATEQRPSYLEILGEANNTVEESISIPPVEAMGDDFVRFVATAAAHPETSITQLYALANLSRAKGNRLKEEAEALGLIVVEEGQSTNGRPPKFIRLTRKGKALLHDLQG